MSTPFVLHNNLMQLALYVLGLGAIPDQSGVYRAIGAVAVTMLTIGTGGTWPTIVIKEAAMIIQFQAALISKHNS
jgi:hypothetical protein